MKFHAYVMDTIDGKPNYNIKDLGFAEFTAESWDAAIAGLEKYFKMQAHGIKLVLAREEGNSKQYNWTPGRFCVVITKGD